MPALSSSDSPFTAPSRPRAQQQTVTPIRPKVQSAGTIPFAAPTTPGIQLLRFDTGALPTNEAATVSRAKGKSETRGTKPQLVRRRKTGGSEASKGRRFLCLHIPHFAAWVALQADASLRQIPFAVYQDGHIVAASPMAQRAGVEVDQSTVQAQARCTDLQLLPHDIRREMLAWDEIQRAFCELTVNIESMAPGLLMADAGDLPTEQFATLVRAWKVPAGLAHDRATAHLAALTAPAGKVRTVAAGQENEFARIVPMALLGAAGVPQPVLDRLARSGWDHVASLRGFSQRQLEDRFGPAAELLWRYGQTYRCEENLRPVEAWVAPAEIEARFTFELPAREPEQWQGAVTETFRHALLQVGPRRIQTVEIMIETALGTFRARRLLREPLGGGLEKRLTRLQQTSRNMFQEALRAHPALEPVITGLEVRLGGFEVAPEPGTMFEATEETPVENPGLINRAVQGVARYFPEVLGITHHKDIYIPRTEDSWSWQPPLGHGAGHQTRVRAA